MTPIFEKTTSSLFKSCDMSHACEIRERAGSIKFHSEFLSYAGPRKFSIVDYF